jgi:hypothetical protein
MGHEPVPAAPAERPLSVQLRDLSRQTREHARSAESGNSNLVLPSASRVARGWRATLVWRRMRACDAERRKAQDICRSVLDERIVFRLVEYIKIRASRLIRPGMIGAPVYGHRRQLFEPGPSGGWRAMPDCRTSLPAAQRCRVPPQGTAVTDLFGAPQASYRASSGFPTPGGIHKRARKSVKNSV